MWPLWEIDAIALLVSTAVWLYTMSLLKSTRPLRHHHQPLDADEQCAICKREYFNTAEPLVPHTLPCGHMWCRCCFQEYANSNKIKRCPLCLQDIQPGAAALRWWRMAFVHIMLSTAALLYAVSLGCQLGGAPVQTLTDFEAPWELAVEGLLATPLYALTLFSDGVLYNGEDSWPLVVSSWLVVGGHLSLQALQAIPDQFIGPAQGSSLCCLLFFWGPWAAIAAVPLLVYIAAVTALLRMMLESLAGHITTAWTILSRLVGDCIASLA